MKKKEALEIIAKSLAQFAEETQPAAFLVKNRLDSLGHHIEEHWEDAEPSPRPSPKGRGGIIDKGSQEGAVER